MGKSDFTAARLPLANEAREGEARPGVPHVHAVSDIAGFEAGEGAPVWRPGLQIYAPTVVILALYFAAWVTMGFYGKSDGGIARLCLFVMSVGVPILALHAFLRHQTIRVQVIESNVRYHPGWPADQPTDMPLDLIERVRVRRGIAGRILHAGTLVLDLTTGQKVAVADLRDPDRAADAIEAAMAA